MAVYGYDTAGDFGSSTETVAPQRVADQCDFRGVGAIFGGGEVSTEEGREAEGRKEISFDLRAAEPDRVGPGQVATGDAGGERRHGLEGRLIAAEVEVIAGQQKFVGVERGHHADRDQALCVGVGEAAEQDAVDHAEHSGCGTDS